MNTKTSFARLENLNNKVAVITGGAGQIGYATAIRLAQQGARVVLLTRRDLSELQERMKELPNQHRGHFAILASVTNTEDLKEAVKQVTTVAGRCDILVNTVGVSKIVPSIEELTDEVFDHIITTNLRGTYATIREFVGLLRESGDGLVVNISSTAALRASPSNIAYGASKAGLDLMTRSLAKRLAPTIRVVGISPGHLEKATSGIGAISPDYQETLRLMCPLLRIGSADDIASSVEALATTMRFVTGTTLVIDGGRTS